MTEIESDSEADSVKSVETVFDVIEFINRRDGATISEAASELEYAKSTIHRHLSTLERRGYVVNEDGYYVGLRFLEIGEDARNRKLAYQLAKEKVEELAEETDERAQFLVEEHGEAVYIHRAAGDRAIRTDPGIGKRIPLHATASGKGILAAMPPEKMSRIIEQAEFKQITNETITNPDTLYDELDQIRERGYAFNREENLDGLHAIGVPVKGPNGGVIGGLSVSGPSHRLTGERFEVDLPSLLLGTANELELNIAHA
ncbi:IclR family transcriptional regulator [Halobacterium sp. KA-6]|uniref:IclR family transcriptional regulator n=1 Tax=Halobacterium sp. KA-6 TaxID=2896368 RepID=UPI001E64B381|nr:IclR family transcriptional regulator [Halobacterium sp. KA-6]MCD2203370.1 IclR family transcriptional regulator [Halobacterium sp. KA-6]